MDKIELNSLIEKTKKLTLLYVEDDDTIAVNTIKILERFFNTIIFATNGEEALEKFYSNKIDFIISDINMPRINGIEVLQQIRKGGYSTPLIFTTAHGEADYYQRAIDLNVSGYITKPMAVTNLIEKIKEAVDKKFLEDTKNKNLSSLKSANEKLLDIGYKISSEKSYLKILEAILVGAKELSSADGGTLYIYNKSNKTLEFKIAMNNSLSLHFGGTGEEINWPPLNLYDENNNPNRKNVAVVSALDDKLINIKDIYNSSSFDFSGAKAFDTQNNYKTTSMLVIPMENRDNELIGVIQLINKTVDEKVVFFNNEDESVITAMASLATMSLQNNKLVKDLENLLYGLVQTVGTALGEKSAYTGKHVDHVADLSLQIAQAINDDDTIFKDHSFTNDELDEIKLAAWLHDLGKITTPEYVVDKATRLETICDRINTIETRLEVVKRDIEIAYLKNEIDEEIKNKKLEQIESDLEFLHHINSGDAFMTQELENRLNNICEYANITVNNKSQEIITEDEKYNLSIKKGTLTDEEREIINNHVSVTYTMLKSLPFPKKYSNVAKLAGSHHKTVDGKGYGHSEIMDKDMTLADKILAVADIFEALSAHDRPYRGPNTLNQIAKILMFMVNDKHLDKDIVRFFLENKVYQNYVDQNFLDDQLDEINIDFENIIYKN